MRPVASSNMTTLHYHLPSSQPLPNTLWSLTLLLHLPTAVPRRSLALSVKGSRTNHTTARAKCARCIMNQSRCTIHVNVRSVHSRLSGF
jgi:hypothetical protein